MKLSRRFKYSGIIRRKITLAVRQRKTKHEKANESRGTRVEGLFDLGLPEARSWKPVVSVRGSGAPQPTTLLYWSDSVVAQHLRLST